MDHNLHNQMPSAIPTRLRAEVPTPFAAGSTPKGKPGQVNSSTSKPTPHIAPGSGGGHTSDPIHGDTSGKKGVKTGA